MCILWAWKIGLPASKLAPKLLDYSELEKKKKPISIKIYEI